jgi:hypothetical protein
VTLKVIPVNKKNKRNKRVKKIVEPNVVDDFLDVNDDDYEETNERTSDEDFDPLCEINMEEASESDPLPNNNYSDNDTDTEFHTEVDQFGATPVHSGLNREQKVTHLKKILKS